MMFEGSHDNYEIVANISKQYFNETFNEDLNVNYCQNNVSSYQCKQLFTTTKDNGDTVVKICNPGPSEQLTIKLKVLTDSVNIINENNEVVESDRMSFTIQVN